MCVHSHTAYYYLLFLRVVNQINIQQYVKIKFTFILIVRMLLLNMVGKLSLRQNNIKLNNRKNYFMLRLIFGSARRVRNQLIRDLDFFFKQSYQYQYLYSLANVVGEVGWDNNKQMKQYYLGNNISHLLINQLINWSTISAKINQNNNTSRDTSKYIKMILILYKQQFLYINNQFCFIILGLKVGKLKFKCQQEYQTLREYYGEIQRSVRFFQPRYFLVNIQYQIKIIVGGGCNINTILTLLQYYYYHRWTFFGRLQIFGGY
eukprot:TRINITY_DN10430_c1_g1_i2.p2 TRINITY_DN10430_c1_g1~~TRINITY_DN10430_c1_g1_i2.p2  ORF type:complete len:262 (-),score=-13.97 TRINITY_DN10430_c1_g1_i2:681-1466(-)